MKFITFDIKDLYVNLPIPGIMRTIRFWLNKQNNHNNQMKEQMLTVLDTIIKQNYFHYEDQIYQQEEGKAMGSPISSMLAEIYLQYLENIYIKHWLNNKEILFYKRLWMTF